MYAMPHDEHFPKWTIKNLGFLYSRKGDVVTITPKEAVLLSGNFRVGK